MMIERAISGSSARVRQLSPGWRGQTLNAGSAQRRIAAPSVTAVAKLINPDTLAQPLSTNSYHPRRQAFRTLVEFP
jgi:hypothetical protein